jgi:hypothetical protein
MNDPVEWFLTSDFAGPAPSALQQAVLATTTRELRWRRRLRRFRWTAALAACFLAGVGTTSLWRGFQPSEEVSRSAPATHSPTAAPLIPREPPSLVELEWRAFDSRDNRAALFFEVARRYLEEQHDFDSALRCYCQALDAAPQEDLAIRPDDNWLVMALKEARQKENSDATFNR